MPDYHLAQINIAKFRKSRAHPDNRDFYAAIESVHKAADEHAGFVWRWTEDDMPVAIRQFRNPKITINMTVWESLEALGAFAYRQSNHKTVFARKDDWFEPLPVSVALWWVPAGHLPSIEEGKERLDYLEANGPSERAFTFKERFPAPVSV